ncbi:Hypothetical predicted protein [Mytilus galloprovincialis]|uniref:Uncharacterized protein n=1 Tax=Mytilus galloprovincialis TaxID=29158 RepID=A0A8B6CTC7_MYTGA|nr:Hypothetical predicted protein [Mytilus galloprovincialis]
MIGRTNYHLSKRFVVWCLVLNSPYVISAPTGNAEVDEHKFVEVVQNFNLFNPNKTNNESDKHDKIDLQFFPQNKSAAIEFFKFDKTSAITCLLTAVLDIRIGITVNTRRTIPTIFIVELRVGKNKPVYTPALLQPGVVQQVQLNRKFKVTIGDKITVKARGTPYIDRRPIFNYMEISWIKFK